MVWNFLFILIRFEWQSERRKRASLPSILLYVISILFILFQIHQLHPFSMGAVLALYWILQLFFCVWFAFEVFQGETHERALFWHQLFSIEVWFISKALYIVVVIILLSNMIWFLFSLLFDILPFAFEVEVVLSLAMACFACVFTFLSYVGFVIRRQVGLVSVLGLPIITPILLITLSIMKHLLSQGISYFDMVSYAAFYLITGVLIICLGVYLVPHLKST